MNLDAKQKETLAALKQAVRTNGLSFMMEQLGMHRGSLQGVISDTAREGTVLLALDKFLKAKK